MEGDGEAPVVTISLDLVALLYPMATVMAEMNIADRFAAAFLAGGYGWSASHGSAVDVEFGVQFQAFFFGDFTHGLSLALEFHQNFGRFESGGLRSSHRVFQAGPLVAYKFVSDFGLSVAAHLGAGVRVFRLLTSGSFASDMSGVHVAPMGHLLVGWSF